MALANSMDKKEENCKLDQENKSVYDAAPSWILPLFTKMKAEIKKEIMEEVTTLLSKSYRVNTRKDKKSDNPHEEIYCDHCDQLILGIRYKCGNCEDFDLCQECENIPNVHNPSHIFLKIRYPIAVKCKHKKQRNVLGKHSVKAIGSSVSVFHNDLVENKIPRFQILKPDKFWRLYDAQYISDETFPDSSVLAPSTKFTKSWRVLNSGAKPWTQDTKLNFYEGTELIPESYKVNVPLLKPREEGIVSVVLIAPSDPGWYQCNWHFSHKEKPFGHGLWCNIRVEASKNNNDKQKDKKESEKKNETRWDEIIAPIINAANDQAQGGSIPRKLAVASHTATPNNTPFDLTPPKSPDHQETSAKEIPELDSTNVIANTKPNRGSDDDECSVLSFSSDSDTEFVVIPMPKCFNMSESFVSRQLSHITQQLASKSLSSERNILLEKHESDQNNLNQQTNQIGNLKKGSGTEAVSQETGVPELTENIVETVLEVVQQDSGETDKKIFVSRLSIDGSSSEISIIESEENSSPLVENIVPTIDTISIAVSNASVVKQESSSHSSHNEVKTCSQAEQKEVENINNESSNDIPTSSITFPKYPIEGINETSPNLPKEEERTIQVLPEGIVTGVLSGAACFYNTAKAVISTIQQPRTEKGACLSRELPVAENFHQNDNVKLNPMDQLIEMGFCNRLQNDFLLRKHKGDMALVVAELVNLNDNDWYASRHYSQESNLDQQ